VNVAGQVKVELFHRNNLIIKRNWDLKVIQTNKLRLQFITWSNEIESQK
jgi:hypothetical protein